MYARSLTLLSLLIVFLVSPQSLSQQVKPCGDLNLSFHGEIGYVRTIKTGDRKGEVERVRLIRPLGPTYGPNSNDWKRVFVELPKNLRSDASEISVETQFQLTRTRRALELKNGPFNLGPAEGGFYPILETRFLDLLPDGPYAPGILKFTLKIRDQVLCEHFLATVTGD